ncbi:hypothetical protein [uncultured Kordia sp.]|uniref:hypothetical protein n=1 Tax=uncultured Kordia sp. TaxID=507699 RepID=UPI00262E72C9|nr:hypothetical protein [uncultured Kordia sp.]
MKKKKLKNLSLKKSSVSKLNGGAAAPAPISLNFPCQFTQDLINCTWYSELYTACTCPPSWQGNCGSINIPCPGTLDLACGLESVRICEA